jgi:hypothetical protein
MNCEADLKVPESDSYTGILTRLQLLRTRILTRFKLLRTRKEKKKVNVMEKITLP